MRMNVYYRLFDQNLGINPYLIGKKLKIWSSNLKTTLNAHNPATMFLRLRDGLSSTCRHNSLLPPNFKISDLKNDFYLLSYF